ncbi:hypothetical protein J6590_027982 [Homalodisca vitripennis]|nr:hypothetical protein J6590_027982 [Homalodisca vitripennis]
MEMLSISALRVNLRAQIPQESESPGISGQLSNIDHLWQCLTYSPQKNVRPNRGEPEALHGDSKCMRVYQSG